MINIILFGPPGAGKGTQSEKIIAKYNLTHLSTGDLFRKHLKDGTDLGKNAQSYLDQGNLVPDEIVINMVGEKIDQTSDSAGFIFDGFPRTVNQAEALDQLMENKSMPINGLIALEVPEEELINRILERGKISDRSDDQDRAKINHRIQVYQAETVPVAQYFENQNKLTNIHGSGGIDEIFGRITQVIDTF